MMRLKVYDINEPVIKQCRKWFWDTYGIKTSKTDIVHASIHCIESLPSGIDKVAQRHNIKLFEGKIILVREEYRNKLKRILSTLPLTIKTMSMAMNVCILNFSMMLPDIKSEIAMNKFKAKLKKREVKLPPFAQRYR